MAKFKIVFKQSVAKELRPIPNKGVKRILEKIDQLSIDPCLPGSKKLTGQEKYRLRQGSYRILYTIEEEVITVIIVKVGHRKDSY